MFARLAVPLAVLLTASLACADYEYRYVEGEAFARSEIAGLRDEGFTSWMGHPSGGKVVVFGTPAGGFVEYDIADLQEGEYVLRIRCLAIPTTRTHVLWDGKDLGLITHDQASTSLRWSQPVGPVQGAGKHVLRLQGSDGTTQWPYIDVILLTNVKDYAPPAQDQDFVSYKTAWPLLQLKGEKASTWVAPLPSPSEGPAISRPAVSDLQVQGLVMAPPVIGDNAVQVTLKAAQAATANLAVVIPPSQGATQQVHLAAGTPQTVSLTARVASAGQAIMALSVAVGQDRAEGRYALDIPPVGAVTLDEYAYPSTQRTGQWSAAFACTPQTLAKMSVLLIIKDLRSGKTVLNRTLPAKPQLDVPFDLVGLAIGRFRAEASFLLDGVPVQADAREFIKYAPVAWPIWEPVRVSTAVGDTITVNDNPFLARMLYHAPRADEIVNHGFNAVQCYGGDPDPLPGIQKCLDDCQKVGLYGTVALFNNQYFNKGPEFNLAHIEEAVLKFKDHPAVLCWDLIDEPEPSMKPEAVQAAADLIRRLDPNHFVWVNLCRNVQITDYIASQDLWSFDSYPFPQMTPFDYKTRWLNQTDQLLAGKKPLGTCLQTFNYNLHEQRMPTPDELRTSAWLHVVHGYKWFGYYSYYDGEPSGCLSRDPVLFSYTRALNTELVQLQAVVLAPGLWKDVAFEPKTDKLEAREKEAGGKLYVVIVSDSKDPLTVTLSPSWASAKRRLLIESEMKPVTGPFKTTVRPVGTQVWELTK